MKSLINLYIVSVQSCKQILLLTHIKFWVSGSWSLSILSSTVYYIEYYIEGLSSRWTNWSRFGNHMVAYLLLFGQLWISVRVSIYCKKKLLWWGLRITLTSIYYKYILFLWVYLRLNSLGLISLAEEILRHWYWFCQVVISDRSYEGLQWKRARETKEI